MAIQFYMVLAFAGYATGLQNGNSGNENCFLSCRATGKFSSDNLISPLTDCINTTTPDCFDHIYELRNFENPRVLINGSHVEKMSVTLQLSNSGECCSGEQQKDSSVVQCPEHQNESMAEVQNGSCYRSNGTQTEFTTPNSPQENNTPIPSVKTQHSTETNFQTATDSSYRQLDHFEGFLRNYSRSVLGEAGDANDAEVAILIRNASDAGTDSEPLFAFSGTTVQRVVTGGGDKEVGFVLAQIRPPVSELLREVRGEVTETIHPTKLPGLSITAFGRSPNRTMVQASPTYQVVVEGDTSADNAVASLLRSTNPQDRTVIRSVNYVCRFYDAGRYSGRGCDVVSKTDGKVTCMCNHTTIFAVLLSVESFTVPWHVEIVSYVTESVSVVCLILTLVVLLKVRIKIRNDRTVVQINLTLSLLLLHTFNLFHNLALKNNRACEMIAVLMHFFLLATAMWMFVEGLNLLLKTTNWAFSNTSNTSAKISVSRLVIGWGIPFVIVAIAATVGFVSGSYLEKLHSFGYKRCWVGTQHGLLLGSVVVPEVFVYTCNILVAAKVVMFVYKKDREAERFKPSQHTDRDHVQHSNSRHLKTRLNGFLLLLPVLGVPWVFAFLVGLPQYEARVTFMYLNVILNGLQGFFLFLVYCVCGSEVRKAWMRKLTRIQANMFSFTNGSRQTTSKLNSRSSATTPM